MTLTRLFFSLQGRISRADFWYAELLLLSVFVVVWCALDAAFGYPGSWALYLPLYWAVFAVALKRNHDLGRSGVWLLLALVPVIGPLWVIWSLGCRKGSADEHRFGRVPPQAPLDYLVVGQKGPETLINDVTGINPVTVREVERPTSVEAVQRALAESTGPVSVGGGRFSMGGQVASPGSLHLDMRGLNQILAFSPGERWIRVQAGARWCDLQRFLDPHDLSVKIMQTYANFTVGGSLNVNAHGRYMGLGPVILSVRSIAVVLADGTLQHASPSANSELFYGVIGGYGGLGVIVEAELDVVPNVRVGLELEKLDTPQYLPYFRRQVRDNPKAIFHNADLYPPHYGHLLAQTWVETEKPVTQPHRLMLLRAWFPLERYFFWAVAETPLGTWRREFVFDPIFYFKQKVHWRNYEAGYTVAELEPRSREASTFVLLEYFVPLDRFEDFVAKFRKVLQRHQVKMLNVSIRHALADPGSLLAWAREEVLAFVMYYKQGTEPHERAQVGVWTRELIEAVLSVGGTYYLPYQAHATPEQFHRAYPRAVDFFALKRQLDPAFRFRNVLWDKYYAPTLAPAITAPAPDSEFRAVFADVRWSDAFYAFLTEVFHLYPEARFHWLLTEAVKQPGTDRELYERVQAGLPGIKPALSLVTLAVPALLKQKREMARQTLALLGDRRRFDGYVEIGSTGRYISELRKHLQVTGPLYLINDLAPTNGPGDIVERGQLATLGQFQKLDYQPIDAHGMAASSIDLLTCYIGLHHAPLELLEGFVISIHRVLRPGGVLILRDHDVATPEMRTFVSLVHTVFNLGLGVDWETDHREFKCFRSADEWTDYLARRGFEPEGRRLAQANDPTDNLLMAFTKRAEPAPVAAR